MPAHRRETQIGNNAVDQAYQCNLVTSVSSTDVQAYDFWPGHGAQSNTAPWSGSFAVASDFTYTDKIVGTTHTCSFKQGTTPATATQSAGPHVGYVLLGAQYATVGYDYLFVVEIGS